LLNKELSQVEPTSTPYSQELAVAIAAAKEAAAVVRDLYERSAAESYVKGDGSPVTDADLAADRIIRQHLISAFPDDAILTEEGADDHARLGVERCWLVDPVDGTQQFIDRTGEFDILIALVVGERPVAGLLLQPTTGVLLSATSGGDAWIEQDGIRSPLKFEPSAGAPRMLTSIWLGAPENFPVLNRVANRLGSPPVMTSRFGVTVRHFVPPGNHYDALLGLNVAGRDTMGWEWDFAAADILVQESGGVMTDLDGNLHRYNKPIPRNNNGLIFAVDPETHASVLMAVAAERAEVATL
jgi:3'-phosphoadenosine 5'-phosphosulfate (PAPS) 3'-phosphatase